MHRNKYYKDPTADKAIGHVSRDERRDQYSRESLDKLLFTIFYICDQAGYDVMNRISLRDRRTGKVWR